MNKFDQLVEDLADGSLSFNQLHIAYRTSIRRSKDIPEGIKDLLCGSNENNAGLIFKFMKPINELVGNMELAYRRGKD